MQLMVAAARDHPVSRRDIVAPAGLLT